jgi:hypothetical protein
MWAVTRSSRHWAKVAPLAVCFMAVSLVACSDDESQSAGRLQHHGRGGT